MSGTDRLPLPAIAVRRLTALGIDCAALLKRAGLPQALLTDPAQRLTTGAFFHLWQTLGEVSDDPMLGLRLGAEIDTGQLDVASTAAAHAASLRDALAKMARYKRLLCPEEISLLESGGEARVEFRWTLTAQAPPAMLIDSCLASTLLLARYGSGDGALAPLRVDYARPEKDKETLERHYGCAVRFNAAVDGIVFDAALLDQPFVTHNPDLLAMLQPGLEAGLQALDGLQGADLDADAGAFLEQVATAVRRQMQGQRPNVNDVARDMAMSQRTLQRRLAAHGTSYQAVLDEVRRHTAQALLDEGRMDAGEIAFLLGFEELNSFTRAFRGWSGTTPQRWREGVDARRRPN
jgi:AraC-like DNA-binding protein